MIELPKGEIIESRRGNNGILKALLDNMKSQEWTGYIRTERKPKDETPSQGFLLVLSGDIHAALHEKHRLLSSQEAMIEIEDDALHLDCILDMHLGVDVSEIVNLYPNAVLKLETQTDQSKWWESKVWQSKHKRRQRLPAMEVVESAPEHIQRKAESLLDLLIDSGQILSPGDSYLIDSLNGEKILQLSNIVADLNRPVLFFTRNQSVSADSFSTTGSITPYHLGFKQSKRNQEPDLQSMEQNIDEFLSSNIRSFVVIEGLDYLAIMNEEKEIVHFMRELIDAIRYGNHCLISSVDLSVFQSKNQHLLIREAPIIDDETIDRWLNDHETLSQHPFFGTISGEEMSLFQSPEIIEEDDETQTYGETHHSSATDNLQQGDSLIDDEQLDSKISEVDEAMEIEAPVDQGTDTESGIIHEIPVVEKPAPVKPRPAQRVKKYRKKRIKNMSNHELMKASLNQATLTEKKDVHLSPISSSKKLVIKDVEIDAFSGKQTGKKLPVNDMMRNQSEHKFSFPKQKAKSRYYFKQQNSEHNPPESQTIPKSIDGRREISSHPQSSKSIDQQLKTWLKPKSRRR